MSSSSISNRPASDDDIDKMIINTKKKSKIEIEQNETNLRCQILDMPIQTYNTTKAGGKSSYPHFKKNTRYMLFVKNVMKKRFKTLASKQIKIKAKKQFKKLIDI